MRKLLSIGALAAAVAILPAAPTLAAASRMPTTGALARTLPADDYWYVYDTGLDFNTCGSWGEYFMANGSAYSFDCPEDSNGDGLYTLLLLAEV